MPAGERPFDKVGERLGKAKVVAKAEKRDGLRDA